MISRTRMVICAALAAVCMASGQTNGLALYSELESERFDFGRAKRLRVWIAVPDGQGSNEVRRAMEDVVQRHTGMHAVCVAVMRDGETAKAWPYTVGKCVWAPEGDWGRALDGLSDPRRTTYKMTVELNPHYFGGAPRPTLHGLSARDMAAVASDCCLEIDHEQIEVLRRDPLAGKSKMAEARHRAVARVSNKRGLSADQLTEIWEIYNLDVARCMNPELKP